MIFAAWFIAVTLTWDPLPPNCGVVGYDIHYGPDVAAPWADLSVGNVTTAQVNVGGTNYYRVTGRDAIGRNSMPSNQVVWPAAATPTPTPIPTPIPVPITIGETNILPSADTGSANWLVAQRAILSQTATIESISFYVTAAAGNLRLGLYDSSGPSAGPGKKIAETAGMIPAIGWNTAPVVSKVTLQPGSYWLAYLPSSNALAFRKQLAGEGAYYIYFYAVMPNTFSTNPTKEAAHWSIYATLSTASIPSPTPIPTPTATPTPIPSPTSTPTPTPTPTPVPTPSVLKGYFEGYLDGIFVPN